MKIRRIHFLRLGAWLTLAASSLPVGQLHAAQTAQTLSNQTSSGAFTERLNSVPNLTASEINAGNTIVNTAGNRLTHTLSLHDLGQRGPLALRGVEDQRFFPLHIPSNWQLQRVTASLDMRVSPDLLARFSHLSLLVNGEVAATTPLTPTGTMSSVIELELPAHFFKQRNSLGFRLIAHATLACENPRDTRLWVDIAPASTLSFSYTPKRLPNDLALLPAPFFEPMAQSPVSVDFVIANPSPEHLKSASIVASWLGILAGARGVDYSVHTNSLPNGHAIVIGPAPQLLPQSQASRGPSLELMENPANPMAKLLVINGAHAKDIETAARGLALASHTLSGSRTTVDALDETPRLPYDAPYWLPSDRPVTLGEWINPASLWVQGDQPAPIDLALRTAPDLTGWNRSNVPLNLLIRDSIRVNAPDGRLSIYLNRELLEELELRQRPLDWLKTQMGFSHSGTQETTILLPITVLGSQPFLQFQFQYPLREAQACAYALTETQRGAIDPASTLDLTDLTHYLAMPDMASFGNSFFPFTRLANLNETTVVLARDADYRAYESLLMMMARAGQATGYPTTGVQIVKDPEPETLQDQDILILDTGSDSRALEAWRNELPSLGLPRSMTVADNQEPLKPGSLASWLDTLARWVQPVRDPRITAPASGNMDHGTFIAGFESPVSNGRSVIVMSAPNSQSLRHMVSLISTNPEQVARMQGSAVVMQGQNLYTASVAKTYYAGELGPARALLWYFGQHPLLLTLVFLAGGLMSSIVIYLALRQRAKERLHG